MHYYWVSKFKFIILVDALVCGPVGSHCPSWSVPAPFPSPDLHLHPRRTQPAEAFDVDVTAHLARMTAAGRSHRTVPVSGTSGRACDRERS